MLSSASKELRDVVLKQSGVSHPVTALGAGAVPPGLLHPRVMLRVPMAEPQLVLLHELLSSWEGTGKVSAAEKKHQPQFGG